MTALADARHGTRVLRNQAVEVEPTAAIAVRLPRHLRGILEEAAALEGTTLNRFVLYASVIEAQRVIRRDREICLSRADSTFLMALVTNPPAPNRRLRKAFRAYKEKTFDAEGSNFKCWPRQDRDPGR